MKRKQDWPTIRWTFVATFALSLFAAIAMADPDPPVYPACCKYSEGGPPQGPCSACQTNECCHPGCDSYCAGSALSQCKLWCDWFRPPA